MGINYAPASSAPVLDVSGISTTDGTVALRPHGDKGSRVSHIHYGTNGDWYIRSASTSGTVHIQDGGGSTSVGTLSASTLSLSSSSNHVLDVNGTNQYASRITHNRNNNAVTFSDALFMQNTNSTSTANYVSIGLSTSSTDGQHHRVQMRARHDTAQTYGGMFEIRTRGAGAANTVGLSIDSYQDVFIPNGDLRVGLSSGGLGRVHIKEGSSGQTSVNSNFDQLVLEDDSHSGMTILSGTSSDGAIYFGDSGGNARGQIKYKHASDSLNFTTADGSEALVIDSSANVGINATSAGATLHVNRASTSYIDILSDASLRLRMYGDNSQAIVGAEGVPLKLKYGASEALVIDSSSDVSIPNGKLMIESSSNGFARIEGPDANHMIIMRGHRDSTSTGTDMTTYYQYGGTRAEGKGHLFYTGGALASQSLRLGIHNDAIAIHQPLYYGSTQIIDSSLNLTNFNSVIFPASNGDMVMSLNDGSVNFRADNDHYHKMWYFDGLCFATNKNHGHFRFYAETNTQRNNSTGGDTLVFDIDSQNQTVTASGNITAYSDIKLKDDIQPIENALDKVCAIRGVTFTRNDHQDKTKRHMGVIAQEVEAAGLNEVVEYNEEKDVKTVSYGNMVGVLIEAIKEQQQTIDSLTKRIEELENGDNENE